MPEIICRIGRNRKGSANEVFMEVFVHNRTFSTLHFTAWEARHIADALVTAASSTREDVMRVTDVVGQMIRPIPWVSGLQTRVRNLWDALAAKLWKDRKLDIQVEGTFYIRDADGQIHAYPMSTKPKKKQ